MGSVRRQFAVAAPFLACIWLLPICTQAQTGSDAVGLSPSLTEIKKRGAVRLGYRESSIPFSFLDEAGRPIGYSLELCEAIVEQVGKEVDEENLKIDYVK